jgi:alanine transaminase
MMLTRRALARSFGILNLKTINPDLVAVEFPERNPIDTALFLSEVGVATGERFAFSEFMPLQTSNSHALGQSPITFNRQVLSLCLQPDLMESSTFSEDAKTRAREYIKSFISLGCYTDSAGNAIVTRGIAEYIKRRDGVPSDPKKILVFNGMSEALSSLVQTFTIREKNSGFMLPVPEYPSYAARIRLNGAHPIEYDLDESNGWEISEEALRQSYEQATKKGVDIRGIIAINPGNPTGTLLSRSSIESIFRVAYEKGLVVFASEVNQEAVLTDKKNFISFKKVLSELPSEVANSVELISFHSCSKGFHGEGGLRGGYVELHNIDPGVAQEIYKLKTIYLSSSSAGQVMLDLMARPPTNQTASEATVNQYNKEIESLYRDLKSKSGVLEKTLRSMSGVTVGNFEAGYHAFPKIDLPPKFVEEAKAKQSEADLHYCKQVLINTGVTLAPGSTFKTIPNRHYIRCSILGQPLSFYSQKLEEWRSFHDKLMKKYQ